jgi:hypothetical protein
MSAETAPVPLKEQFSRGLFPSLIAGSFKSGLYAAFDFAIVASLLAAVASWGRGSDVPDASVATPSLTTVERENVNRADTNPESASEPARV